MTIDRAELCGHLICLAGGAAGDEYRRNNKTTEQAEK
jgi:hypothetical protein